VKNFAQKSFSLLKRDVMLFVTNTITGIVVARQLGPELRGLYSIVLLLPGYAEAFGRIKLDVAAVYFLGKKRSSVGEMIFLLNTTTLATSALIIFIILYNYDFIYAKLFAKAAVDMTLVSYSVLLLIPLQFLFLNYSYLTIFREDIKVYNTMIVMKAMIASTLSVLALVVFDYGIWGVLGSSIISMIISVTYASIMLSRVEKMVPKYDFNLLFDMVRYSSRHYLAGIVGHLQSYSTNLLAALYLSPASVGFFSMAKNQGDLITRMVPGAINTLLYPKIAKSEDIRDSIASTRRSFRISILILVLVTILFAAIVRNLVIILYGDDYTPMVTPFLIMIPGIVLFQSASVLNSFYSGTGRVNTLLFITVIPVIIQISLALYMIPAHGVIGASLSYLIACVLVFIVNVTVFIKISESSLADLLITKSDIRFVYSFVKNTLSLTKNN
jgi:O-antigen/teichoic acid export membrane protein